MPNSVAIPAVSSVPLAGSSSISPISLLLPGPLTVMPGTLPGLSLGGAGQPGAGHLVGLPRYTPGQAPSLGADDSPPATAPGANSLVLPGIKPGTTPGIGPGPGYFPSLDGAVGNHGRVVVVNAGSGSLGQGGEGDDWLLYSDALAKPERFDGGLGHDRLLLAEGCSLGGHDRAPSNALTDDQWVGVEEIHFYARALDELDLVPVPYPTASQGAALDYATEPLQNRVNLSGQSEAVRVFGGQALVNRFITGEGHDTLYGGLRGDFLDAAGGNDQLFGMAGNDSLIGGLGHDHLDGGNGDDFLLDSDAYSVGLPDDDTLVGGEGADEFVVWSGRDQVLLQESKPAPDMVRVFPNPGVFCRVEGFVSGQDTLRLHYLTSAHVTPVTGQLGGLHAVPGDLALDTLRVGIFYFVDALIPVNPHGVQPQLHLCSGRLSVASAGDRALVVIHDPATASHWVYALHDLNKDREINGVDELKLVVQVVGAQLMPGDVLP